MDLQQPDLCQVNGMTVDIEADKRFTLRECLFLAVLIGVVVFVISVYMSYLSGGDASDFKNILVPARDWLAGKDIYLAYKQNIDPSSVPYPFTGYLFSFPFSWMSNRVAAATFFSLGSGLLAWYILRSGKNWLLLMFLSWPFVYSLIYAQFSPFTAAIFFTPSLLFFIFIKPQMALPFVLTQKPNRLGLVLAGLFLVFSLVLYPLWPIDWYQNLHLQQYIGSPPLLTLPFGPLILLALIHYRERRSWILVLMGAMPQRMVYDQLGVLLVANTRKQLLFLVICSWMSFPVVLYYHGWINVPFGWKQWVLFESYIPALLVVLLPELRKIFSRLPKLVVTQ